MARKSHKGDRASSSAVQCNKRKLTGVYRSKGKWGVQIYANKKRIWLGTFKSEREAALAYDRASIKLKGKDCPRNLPNEAVFERESSFQSGFTREQIVEMIKDHSYDEKLHNKPIQICKVLTTSDLGSLNRLVIPKKYSNHLPKHMVDNGQTIELTFFNSDCKERKFKFKHCTSSGSYMFTSGWRNFVKAKRLEAGDTVYFTPHSTRGNTFHITISRSTSTEGLNSVPQEGRDPGAALINMSTMSGADIHGLAGHGLKTEKTDTAKPLSGHGLKTEKTDTDNADIHGLVGLAGHGLKTEKTDTAKPLSGQELKTQKTDTHNADIHGLAGHGLKTEKTDTAKPSSGHELETQKTDTDNHSFKLFGFTIVINPAAVTNN